MSYYTGNTNTDTTATIRLGTASPSTQANKTATLAQLASIAHRAAAQRVDLLLLPEAYVGGYPRGTSFGSLVGGRTRAGRDEFARYFEAAVDLGDIVGDGGGGGGDDWVKRRFGGGDRSEEEEEEEGGAEGSGHHHEEDGGVGGATAAPQRRRIRRRGDGTREELERIARNSGVFLVVGLVERAGGTLYCAVVYVCPREGMLGKRRKVMPTGCERLCWGQGSPGTLRAVSTTIRGVRVNLAAAICWENYMPLLRQSLYAQNINVYLAPTADARDTWASLMRTVAVEGRCFVVSSNMCQRREQQQQQQHRQAVGSRSGGGGAVDDFSSASRRRNSMMTADGHEIALPPPRATAAAASDAHAISSASHNHRRNRSSRRRMSVLDDDGNEIVLSCCCPDDDDSSNSSNSNSNSSNPDRQVLVNGIVSPSAADDEDNNDDEDDNHHHDSDTTTPTAAAAAAAYDGDDKTVGDWLSRGGSCIVSPYGRLLAGPQWEDDSGSIIYADVDLRDCVRGRLDLDAAGSYSRNDSFKLSVAGLDLDPLPYF